MDIPFPPVALLLLPPLAPAMVTAYVAVAGTVQSKIPFVVIFK
jgi:hypothetical protein